ncbi:hypothetical protein J4050_00145 [Winogradskyella sp. DF17]|uniref:Uncharacterized protein n=1 Tax=Winogradskyella pelagia TaxID=2819984 RepID=A0ABS3SXB1_9FLAO|nr:hypothetical protein [Winogradskyella sp. DF17]MBO3115133.1 hypothetical protein [Winogradskyella sp. DF17]
MRQIICIYFILFQTVLLIAQQNRIIKDSLSLSKDLPINGSMFFENMTISFSRVIQDSRCPKTVMCVRAGEADIELILNKKPRISETITIRIDASGFVSERNNLIAETDNYKLYAFSLSPYPIDSEPIDQKDYILEVVIKPKQK